MTNDDWREGHVPRLAELQWSFIAAAHTRKPEGKFGRVVGRWEYNGEKQVLVEYESTTPDVIEFTRRLKPATSLSDIQDGHVFLHDWEVHPLSVGELIREHIPPSKHSAWSQRAGLLEKDMKQNGLRWPIIASEYGGRVIGSNRLRAAHRLGWETIPCYVVPLTPQQMRGI